MQSLDEEETGRVGVGEVVPSLVDADDDADGDDALTTLNVQVDFVAAGPVAAPGPRPRLHTIPLSDKDLQRQYARAEANAWGASSPGRAVVTPQPSAQSPAIPQPPPSVPSVSSFSAPAVPNAETRRMDAETLAEVLSRNSARASWKAPASSPNVAVAKKPARWERRVGVVLLALAASMVVLTAARPDLVEKSVTWLEAVVKVAKA